ncbi:hypothetical protein GCM10027258_46870 [Amycolatopsis stemonae]
MRKILVIAAAGAVLAVGGTTAALAAGSHSGTDDGLRVPTSSVPSSTGATSSQQSTYPTRTHDLGDDHGGRRAEPGDDHGGRQAEPGDDHGRHHEGGDDHGGRR